MKRKERRASTRWGPAIFLVLGAALACFPGGGEKPGDYLAPTPAMPTIRLELREFRTDGPGPPIPGRRIVRFEIPFEKPQEVVTTDAGGAAAVSSVASGVHVAVESPHGGSFYLIPGLPDASLLLAHPDFPPASSTIPIVVQFDSSGAIYDTAAVLAGTLLTAQSASAAGTSSLSMDLQRRNLHTDGTATLAAILAAGGTTHMRAAFARPVASGSTVVLGTALTRVDLTVDVDNAAVAVTSARLRGAYRGVVLSLSPASGEAFLPVSGGTLAPGAFERYYLELEGTATDGATTDGWSARFLVTPAQVAAGLDGAGGTLDLGAPLTGPVTVSTTDAAVPDLEVVAAQQPSLDPYAAVAGEVRSFPVGSAGAGSVLVVAPADRNLHLVRGERSDGTVWIRRVETPVSGAASYAPEVLLETFWAKARASARKVDLAWRLAPEGRNRVGVELTCAAVSRFWTPYFVDSTGAYQYGANVFLLPTTLGGSDPNVTVTFRGEAGPALVETTAVVDAGGSWLLASGTPAPREGDIEAAQVAGIRLAQGTEWLTVVSRTLQDRTGARLTTAASWNERGFAPLRGPMFSSAERSYWVGWEWEP